MRAREKSENEALAAYHRYWNAYLAADLEAFSASLDDNFHLIGTSESEICWNRSEGIAFFKRSTGELLGKTEMRNRNIKTSSQENQVLVTELSDLFVNIEGGWSFYSRVRLSTLLVNRGEGWKVFQQHASFPDFRVEGDQTIALEQIQRENLQLKEAVKRRTIELEQKNRELELEAALEKVRARTMAMQGSNELKEVAGLLFRQIQLMGIPVWTCGFNIWEKGDDFCTGWMSTDGYLQPPFRIPLTGSQTFIRFRKSKETGEELCGGSRRRSAACALSIHDVPAGICCHNGGIY
jgi:hypothetical protein